MNKLLEQYLEDISEIYNSEFSGDRIKHGAKIIKREFLGRLGSIGDVSKIGSDMDLGELLHKLGATKREGETYKFLPMLLEQPLTYRTGAKIEFYISKANNYKIRIIN